MWYVNKLFNQQQVESLSSHGFLVRNSGGVVRIEKYNCGAELRKTPEGEIGRASCRERVYLEV